MTFKTGSVTQTMPANALSTTYQNISGYAKYVMGVLTNTSTSDFISGICDSASSPTNVVWYSQVAVSSGYHTVFMMVPNNYYYKITAASGTVRYWNEYVMPFNAYPWPTGTTFDLAVAPAQRAFIASNALDTVGNMATGNAYYWYNNSGYDMWAVASVTQSNWNTYNCATSACLPVWVGNGGSRQSPRWNWHCLYTDDCAFWILLLFRHGLFFNYGESLV